jgi:hypothetical protein
MSSIATVDVGPVYQLTSILGDCRVHVGFRVKTDKLALIEAAQLRAYHALCSKEPQLRDAWLYGRLKLVCGNRVVSEG